MKEKKPKKIKVKKEYYDTRSYLISIVKRYGIVLLIGGIIAIFFSYVMSNEFQGYSTIFSVISTVGILVASLLIGMVVYSKIDAKKDRENTPEKERDPFSD